MKSDAQDVFVYAHRSNIDRYQKLLLTHLTDNEREFVKRRLGEEEDALLKIAQRAGNRSDVAA